MSDSETFENQSEKEIFLAALEKKTPEERAAFLDGACAGDLTWRERLERLLAAHEQPETLLADQAEAARPTMKRTNWPCRCFGSCCKTRAAKLRYYRHTY